VASNGGKEVELFLKEGEMPLGLKFAVGTLGHILFCLACQVEQGKITLDECLTGKASKRILALAPHVKPSQEEVKCEFNREDAVHATNKRRAVDQHNKKQKRPKAAKTADATKNTDKGKRAPKKPKATKKLAPTKPLNQRGSEEEDDAPEEESSRAPLSPLEDELEAEQLSAVDEGEEEQSL
jgi:hypothetical protein